MERDLITEMAQDVVFEDRVKEGKRITSKWERTGLLEGLDGQNKATVARLMENQLRSILLKEAATQADIIGFQNVAFPIIRRVFAGLIANELVSVQPMSLPSGLLFYMDYRFDTVKPGNQSDSFAVGGSVFGDRNSDQDFLGSGGFYNLNSSYSARERVGTSLFSGTFASLTLADIDYDPDISASMTVSTTGFKKLTLTNAYAALLASGALTSPGELKAVMPLSGTSTSFGATTDGTPVQFAEAAGVGGLKVYRRLTKAVGNDMVFVVSGTAGDTDGAAAGAFNMKISYMVAPTLTGGTSGTLVLDPYESDIGSTPTPVIPELDFRITSTSVTAKSRKLKARWTPELAQDLAAYQNLDAEVELTQVLSEQIALEIDREILAELLYSATGAIRWWSRSPGKFLNKLTGDTVSGPSFTGTVREWYETLSEMLIDAANEIHTKTLRGAANFLVTSPAASTIIEAMQLYKPLYAVDDSKATTYSIGAEKIGKLAQRFTVYKDPYFPKNRILIGYKGSSFLETGYVYAPYVPLIVTPTIYRPDDFIPTKGVMTRYAKQMVRSDFYGRLTLIDMHVI